MKRYIALIILLINAITHACCTPCTYALTEEPQMTIVIVIDQFAYRHLEKLRSYLKYGIKFFLNESVTFTQAYTPYAWPETAPGHASLNTGTVPCDHGIISNEWPTSPNNYMICDEDTTERAAVFGPNGLLAYGKSAANIMVDGLSDQLMLQSDQNKRYKVFSISGKSRAAICTASKLGKAIWLDDDTCMFTSSKAYFDELPAWIKRFNERKKIKQTRHTWHLAQSCLPKAYDFKNAHNYRGTTYNRSLIGKTYALCDQRKEFIQTPYSNQLVFDAALACIDEHFHRKDKSEKLFLWVLPSSLDKVGHNFGPDSIEAIDTIYHLDRQIKHFMDCVNSKTYKRNVLWALTADHGIVALPEQVREEGYFSARRIMGPEVVKNLNAHLAQLFDSEEFSIDNLVTVFDANSIFVDEQRFKAIKKPLKKSISKAIKHYIASQEGIKRVWTRKKMERLNALPNSLMWSFKNQLFKGRSGRFVVQSYPYVYVSQRETGISHQSPYAPDTHIPIMLYQRGSLQRKVVHERVFNTQLAPTLAYLLGVPRPSASTADLLPGVVFKADPCF